MRQVRCVSDHNVMDAFEKLAYLIAEEFVKAFESMEALLEETETEEREKPVIRVMTAKAGRQ